MLNCEQSTVVAVVVTRNRLSLLKECISAVRGQSHSVDEVIVVDNASDDGTADWLKTQPGLTVIRQANLGCAGGMNIGVKEAFRRGCDWFWCMDDDTIASRDCLERLLRSKPAQEADTGYVCSFVHWIDGSTHRMNVPAVSGFDWLAEVLERHVAPVTACSFVSVLIRREAVAQCGLPLAPMFIWWDDVEFTSRIAKKFRGYLVLDSRVLHKTSANESVGLEGLNDATAFKYHYGLRNSVFLQMRRTTPFYWHNLRNALYIIRCNTPKIFRQCSWRVAWGLLRSMVSGLWFNPPVEFP